MNDPRVSSWRSSTAFQFQKEDIPRIIQTIGYSRFNAQYLRGAIHRPIAYPSAVLDLLRPFPNPNNRPRPSGFFGRDSPPFQPILELCDVQSLFNLRQTSSRLREIISESEIFKHIIKALPLYHAILGTKYAQLVLVIDFYVLLTSKGCNRCGQFAMLISIPEWLRLCQDCVETGERRGIGLDLGVSRFVPLDTFAGWLAPGREIPDRYWHKDFGVGLKGQRQHVVEYGKVRKLHQSTKPLSWKALAEFNYLVTCAVPYVDPANGETESGIACKGCIRKLRKHPDRKDGIERVYGREEFLGHFQWCYRAQLLWLAYKQDASIPIDTENFEVIQKAITSFETSQRNR
ncbi:hypothetical protein H9Q72_013188 [Fusarium xylarioides]|uniref:F-box domain-containing protein n=1 Tax=Fusarium xylarioides TaxID=221167 RepID=A0A9P7KVF1_9HYPO|nr:hypothetical protein H9Q70_005614 [Fusarium xylarioides]KAG5758671.1 hypothetical protein H9Q72_013188 [Fusarium xylarioides]KAG5780495.1 hypothetical protein H9Q73_005836 [Fusarium xylarioides]